MIFYYVLTGERVKAIKQIPALFKGSPPLKELLRGVTVSVMALLIPGCVYPRMVNHYRLLKQLKIVGF